MTPKSAVTRENARLAVGQLADYRRFVDHSARANLLPSQPRRVLLDLAQSQESVAIWPEGKSYNSTEPNLIP
ncbi:hypothetical protein [Streptomyces virginiae]|uniref:Uncharacterized protein n=1 Tax=Streptomyces virginiae TaxID=1961 RepID=A0ABZ1TBZ6_STRVG|nr:hypothetical protein [Streptomyces virginiae]